MNLLCTNECPCKQSNSTMRKLIQKTNDLINLTTKFDANGAINVFQCEGAKKWGKDQI